MFFKVLSRFKKIFRSKKLIGRGSLLGIWEKNTRFLKKFRRNEVKYCDFRHFLEKYSLKQ